MQHANGKRRLNGGPLLDVNGKFAKGNPGGPGRPRKEVERAYLEEWAKVVAKALEDAKAGDATARAWLSKHLVGDDPVLLMEVLDRLSQLEAETHGLT